MSSFFVPSPLFRSTTDGLKSAPFAAHARMTLHPSLQCVNQINGGGMRMSCPAVMDPFALTARGDEADALEVSEVAGNFRLHHAKAIGQMADAELALRQQI